ncbi:MAG: 3-hydroxyanthranilate 3,4-dioxygenase [Phycisphaerales bacterium]|nr:3-hydroxyanthranilate 3,4-dioxygenase [Phycisphaerales bacterium]
MPSTTQPVKAVAPPINLSKWVEEHRHLLKPPVSNHYLYRGDDFFVMVIGGPNARNDFHCTASEEYFYQVKGDIYVRIREGGISGPGKIKDYIVREGETFFIPPNVPHAPMRPPGTVGVVVERVRPAGELEHVIFYCPKCGELVEDIEFDCKDIVEHFSQAMKDFWADPQRCTCKACGTKVEAPGPCPGLPANGITSD